MKKCILFIVSCLCFAGVFAQNIAIKGKVVDKTTNAPLPGVEISIQGNKKATVLTNVAGEFNLKAAIANPTLNIHSLGYNDTTITAGADFLVVNMTSAGGSYLDEVVVVGAVLKKSSLTGAVASINAEKISQTPTNDINRALQGKLPGAYVVNSAQPGSASSIQIRGNNSIQFGTSPIFVVDGTIVDQNFNTLNPDDIASIDVLKDASATAMYGSRGANGVVVITTKRGRSGKSVVTYNAWVGWQSFAHKMKLMNADQIYDLRIDAFANQYTELHPDKTRQNYIDSFNNNPSILFADFEQQTHSEGKSYDWLNAVTQTGVQQNHDVAFSGGTDKGNYYISFNYTDQKGIIQNSGYKRYGGRVNLEEQVKPWLKVGTNTTFTRTNNNYVDGSVFSAAVQANPLLPIDTTGLYYLKYGDILNQDQYNPLRSLSILNQANSNRVITANYINISPVKHLNLRSTVSADLTNTESFTYTPSITGQDQRNSYHGSATNRKDTYTNFQWDNSATYTRNFGKHYLSILAATSMQRNNYNYSQINAYGFPNDDFSYKNLSGAYSKDLFQLNSDFVTNTLVSYLARADYSYNNKYVATVTVREDGSSRFGDKNRWGTFPSLALAWDVAKENFMSGIKTINRLKIRAGYGIAGNQNIPNYAFATLYRPSYTSGSVTYLSDGRLGNPNLKWERQKQLDFGADISILNNRLNFTADYFDIHNDNLLMVKTLSTTTGFTNTVDNVGALHNHGIEFNLNFAVLQKKDLRWSIDATLSSASNKITKLYGNVTAIYNKGGYTGVEIQRTGNLFLGESLNNIYSLKFEKIAQESDMDKLAHMDFAGRTVHPGDIIPVDKNGDGKISDDDRYVVGKLDPKFYGGFGTDLSYKSLGLHAFFTYSYGGKQISSFYESMMQTSFLGAANTDLLNRWTPTNTNTTVPRALYGIPRYNYGDVDLGIQNSSFLRMSVLTLSYIVPSTKLGHAPLSNAKLYVSGSNLLLITKDKSYDPETGDYYPNSKTYTVGVTISL